jgi:choline dehydrogenase
MKRFDYIIVGAGAAGCVLAYRLSENPAVSVALIEAGGSDKNLLISMPKGIAKAMSDPALIWAYFSEPEKATAFKPEVWARGRVMGGSSSVNGMMYVRGQPADFNEIAAQSSNDWSWQHIGPAYKAIESHELGADETRGDSGPMRISMPDRRGRLTEAMIEAGVTMGLPSKLDVNTPDNGEGIGYAPRTIYKGRRQSATVAFLDPIRNRANLTIISSSLVDKVNFEGRRAVSVSVISASGQPTETITATCEIILAGGAMASPGILQRSGIGPGELLRGLGIPVIFESPQVGQNLREHRGIQVQWKLRVPLSDNNQYSGWRLLRNVAQYYLTGSGPMTTASYEIGAWLRSDPALPRPDIQFLVAPFSFDFAVQRTRLENFPGMGIVGYPLRPTSRGELNIKSTNPAELPTLTPNYRSTDIDMQQLVATVRLARRYAEQPALKQWIEVETNPGPQYQTDDEIIESFDRTGTCGYHAIGTCRMGSDPESVVDPQLRVRGVEGLRVMDTSIFPQIPSGNTNGPTMAMAWRAADVILRRE